jgi:CubicO group peptidase (beta-lactamase class C family)
MKISSHKIWERLCLIFIIISFSSGSSAAPKSFVWQKSSPSQQGMSERILNDLKVSLEKKGTKSLLIIRNDKIVFEWYGEDFGPEKGHYTASLAKSLVGGMSLLLAMEQSLIQPDAPACLFIPEWEKDEKKSKISIRHLATHTSGLDDANMMVDGKVIPHSDLPGWMGAFWRKDPDPFSISRDQTPLVFTPGTKYLYSNPGMAMLAYAVTAGIRATTYTDIRTILRKKIMEPIGIGEDEWSIGYGQTYKINDLPLVANWGGGNFTARAVARVGRLMLKKGNWQGVQLVDSLWIKRALTYQGTPLPDRSEGEPIPASGLAWYTNFDGVWREVPRDAFAGAGAGCQVLLVVPSLNLIVVRNGSALFNSSTGENFWGAIEKYLFTPVMRSITQPPYPPSDLITKVEFAPSSQIIRLAEGSDNWPMTWANDNHLYTAYGDGWGFEPRPPIKLSLGLAKISGAPDNLQGENIRSMSGERVGQGAQGFKASGMLIVDNVLYMLVRNTGNAQLAWSEDLGKSWEWADWKFETSFGCPTFLNFDQNYNSARDNYVYIYSHDDNSAYQPADGMVLARVQKNQIKHQTAYFYYTGRNKNNQPHWSVDIQQRQAVFKNPAKCYRSGISYNSGLQRYFWIQIIPGDDTREKGGFGIYEAPEPWGPWKTVFYCRDWDVGPGETASLPTKWMSKDGKTAYLVFSGNDSFSVRKIYFDLRKN